MGISIDGVRIEPLTLDQRKPKYDACEICFPVKDDSPFVIGQQIKWDDSIDGTRIGTIKSIARRDDYGFDVVASFPGSDLPPSILA